MKLQRSILTRHSHHSHLGGISKTLRFSPARSDTLFVQHSKLACEWHHHFSSQTKDMSAAPKIIEWNAGGVRRRNGTHDNCIRRKIDRAHGHQSRKLTKSACKRPKRIWPGENSSCSFVRSISAGAEGKKSNFPFVVMRNGRGRNQGAIKTDDSIKGRKGWCGGFASHWPCPPACLQYSNATSARWMEKALCADGK